ncbi:M28 family peptidase [Pseudoalteromonas piscicida]|uniref:M28 family peptidase n=1 Tax=Pseudoalteromonas piscicida TaxID=43662 RepID=UPI0015520E72|nr:M28 family peptidase [Pseudoalteromonas piscicida]
MNYLLRFALVTGLSCIFIWLASGFYSVPVDDSREYIEQYNYSTQNVRKHLEVIAKEPHPTGSKNIKIVRDYLVSELQKLGADASVQQADIQKLAFGNQYFAQVENVIGVFRGSEPLGKALVLMAHYDSFSHSHGANDNGLAVATILETMRIVMEQGGVKNDVIVLLTDAEEQGGLGISAFMERHPLAKTIGLTVNFEARGSNGPLRMFETSSNNDAIVAAFADASPFPLADSFYYSLYQIMGNYSDMSVSLEHGVPGLNLAYSDGFYHYHVMSDSAENVGEDSLLHAATYALSLTEYFGNTALPLEAEGDRVFFNATPSWFVDYPQWVGLLLLLVTATLFVSYMYSLKKHEELKVWGMAWSAIIVLLQLVLILMLANGLNTLLGGGLNAYFAGEESFFQLLSESREIFLGLALICLAFQLVFIRLLVNGVSFPKVAIFIGIIIALSAFESTLLPSMVLLVLAILAMFLYLKVFGKSRKVPYGVNELFAGYLGFWFVLSVVFTLLIPMMAHIFVWPLLISLLCLNIGRLLTHKLNSDMQSIAIFAGAALAIYWWSSYALLVFTAVGHLVPGIAMLFVVLVTGLLVPLINTAMDRLKSLPAMVSGVSGIVLLVVVLNGHQFNETVKKPNELFYFVDTVANTTEWASLDVELDRWTETVFGKEQQQKVEQSSNAQRIYPIVDKGMFAVAAPNAAIEPVTMHEFSTQLTDDTQVISFTLKPKSQLEKLNIFIKSPEQLKSVKFNGESLDNINQAAAQIASLTQSWSHWQYFGLPETGAKFEFQIPADGALQVRFVEVHRGIPESVSKQLSPRPASMMARSYSLASDSFSDMTVIVSEFNSNTEQSLSARSQQNKNQISE